jgi:hypothetical protein
MSNSNNLVPQIVDGVWQCGDRNGGVLRKPEPNVLEYVGPSEKSSASSLAELIGRMQSAFTDRTVQDAILEYERDRLGQIRARIRICRYR